MLPDVRFYSYDAPNSISAVSPPETPLGELAALLAVFKGGILLNGERRKREGGEGKGKVKEKGKERKGEGRGKGQKERERDLPEHASYAPVLGKLFTPSVPLFTKQRNW